MTVELIQFRFSPYNEKVRWALDFKGIAHTRRSLLPGTHFSVVKKLTGQTATPVLSIEGIAFAGSSRILAEIERRWPEPALYPEDPQLLAAAMDIERRFDEDLTPRCRRALLDAMLSDYRYVARMFGGGLVYRAALPIASGMIRKGNGITGLAAVEDGRRANVEALDLVAAASAATGYLAGPTFTIADLAAASQLATLACPDHPDMRRPRPEPDALVAMLKPLAAHPAIGWMKRMYELHRGAANVGTAAPQGR